MVRKDGVYHFSAHIVSFFNPIALFQTKIAKKNVRYDDFMLPFREKVVPLQPKRQEFLFY
jgi:hypothetical protein